MKLNLTRRGFLKAMAGAGALVGVSPRLRRVALEPFVRPPEEVLAGRATWYASTCRQCPAGCGVIVRVINGRARKIEGNPAHPLNRGKLCARGQAGLQALYNPDRLRNAVRQVGGRGSRRFEPLPWSEALEAVSMALESVADPSRIAFWGGLLPDHEYALVQKFLAALGAPAPVLFDLHTAFDGRAELLDLADRWFGERSMPLFDIARTEVIFSFGANFLETWMSPVSQSVDYGDMRQGALGGRGFLVQFEPRLSSTGASADEWVPVEPGTEGLIALGLGRIIVEEGLGRVGSHREHAELYRNVDVAAVSDASRISAEDLLRLARLFSGANQSLAIPGSYVGNLSNGPEAQNAIMALNIVMRRLGREGGVFLPQEVPAASFASAVEPSRYAQAEELIERMASGAVEVLFVHGSNPVYELPPETGFQEAITRVPLVVSFGSLVDETGVWSDLILPQHNYLEGWGYQVPSAAVDRPIVSGQQPVVQPLYDTHSLGDVICSLASRLGGEVAAAVPWDDEVAFLEEVSSELLGSSIASFDARTASGHWSRWRQWGGWWAKDPIQREPSLTFDLSQPLQVPAADFSGDPSSYPFYLQPFESITLSDGRGANQPWLQETPDPMTTARWNTWVQVNPQTAERLGVEDGDLVRVHSPHGEIEVAVVVYPGIRPDVVAIPTGQGHQDYGRFAASRGANVMGLFAASGGRLTWSSTRVQLEATGRSGKLARLESLEGKGRESIR